MPGQDGQLSGLFLSAGRLCVWCGGALPAVTTEKGGRAAVIALDEGKGNEFS